MKKPSTPGTRENKINNLRKQAEKILASEPDVIQKMPTDDIKKLVHELQVHQIELEMQNDELRRTQVEIEESRARYAELYDFSPVGYFTFDSRGKILEVNLAGASLLGAPRSLLINRLFSPYVARENRSFFIDHKESALTVPVKQTCELKLVKKDGSLFYVSMESIAHLHEDGSKRIHSTITDITERKLARDALMQSEQECRYLSTRLLTVQENERKRISFEIHDGVGQSLNTMKYRIETALEELDTDPEKARQHLKALLPYVQENIIECRRLQQNLRPSLLDDLGILDTIGWFSREFETTHPNIRIERKIGLEEKDIPDLLRVVIYRIFQEAMNNVAQHSKANLVRFSLEKGKGTLEMAIQDNGQGNALKRTGGVGLASMEERAKLSGGTFKIESLRGKGTVIRVSWPL